MGRTLKVSHCSKNSKVTDNVACTCRRCLGGCQLPPCTCRSSSNHLMHLLLIFLTDPPCSCEVLGTSTVTVCPSSLPLILELVPGTFYLSEVYSHSSSASFINVFLNFQYWRNDFCFQSMIMSWNPTSIFEVSK